MTPIVMQLYNPGTATDGCGRYRFHADASGAHGMDSDSGAATFPG